MLPKRELRGVDRLPQHVGAGNREARAQEKLRRAERDWLSNNIFGDPGASVTGSEVDGPFSDRHDLTASRPQNSRIFWAIFSGERE